MCKNIRPLETTSIPHLNAMKWDGCVSGHTTGTTQKISTKAILTPICSRWLLTIGARLSWRKRFVSEKFDQNTMLSTQIVIKKLILSLPKHLIIVHVHGMFMRTFPTVLERLGVWSVATLSSSSATNTSGDNALFFEGDVLRNVDGNSCESLTGMCESRLPCRVWVVVTSNRSGFCPESLIFGILDYKSFPHRDDDGTQKEEGIRLLIMQWI